MGLFTRNARVDASTALPGRAEAPADLPTTNLVLGTPLAPPFPAGVEHLILGMGCFWGAERLFWRTPGFFATSVGYSGGFTPNPTYRETCTGRTGHAEVVLVAFRPESLAVDEVLRRFWEGHDPTQGDRQGNDVGSQYRSAIYWTTPAQRDAALASRDAYAAALAARGRGPITTEIAEAGPYYLADASHQQYLEQHPGGYCGLGGTGVACPVGVGVRAG